MTDLQFFEDDEVPRGHVAGRQPLPRPWLKEIKATPRMWALIERHEDPKKALGRANSHRIWAKAHDVPIEVISRTLPGNWEDDPLGLDPEKKEGFVFAKWVGPIRRSKSRKSS